MPYDYLSILICRLEDMTELITLKNIQEVQLISLLHNLIQQLHQTPV